jgi:hypothetical protein
LHGSVALTIKKKIWASDCVLAISSESDETKIKILKKEVRKNYGIHPYRCGDSWIM